MPDATPEWLVEFVDQDGAHEFDHCDTPDDVQVRVRKLFDAGIREVYVYQRVAFTVQVDVTVKARRTRKQKASPAPAEPSGGPPPSGSEPPSAGDTKEGAADLARGETTPARDSASLTQATVERTAEPTASPVSLIPTGKEEESPKEGAERRPAPSPVSVWTCEASFPGDAECPAPAEFDPVTKGRFCALHAQAITDSGRMELHRRHGGRNHPITPVHMEAVG